MNEISRIALVGAAVDAGAMWLVAYYYGHSAVIASGITAVGFIAKFSAGMAVGYFGLLKS